MGPSHNTIPVANSNIIMCLVVYWTIISPDYQTGKKSDLSISGLLYGCLESSNKQSKETWYNVCWFTEGPTLYAYIFVTRNMQQEVRFSTLEMERSRLAVEALDLSNSIKASFSKC